MPEASRAVVEVAHRFADCWNRHDMAAFAELFATDAQFVNVVGMWWKGREEIQQAHAFTHATMFKNSRLTMDGIEVRVPADNFALCRAKWSMEGHTSPEGKPLPARSGILLLVLTRHANGGWLVVDTQNTDIIEGVLPPPH